MAGSVGVLDLLSPIKSSIKAIQQIPSCKPYAFEMRESAKPCKEMHAISKAALKTLKLTILLKDTRIMSRRRSRKRSRGDVARHECTLRTLSFSYHGSPSMT
jgi:hypothetical protein